MIAYLGSAAILAVFLFGTFQLCVWKERKYDEYVKKQRDDRDGV